MATIPKPKLVAWKRGTAEEGDRDVGYILHMLLHIARSEMKITRSFIAEDNPWELDADTIAGFKTYRKAWLDIANGDKTYINFTGTGEDIIGVDRPDPPDGWVMPMKQLGDCPPICCHVDHFDIFDPTLPANPRAKRKRSSVDPDGNWTSGNKFMLEAGDVQAD